MDFSDEEFIQEKDFLSKNYYYISSLNCNLILKEHIYNKKRLIEELSQKSRLLIEKGATYQKDIGYLIFQVCNIFDVEKFAPLTYNCIIHPKLLNDNCYNYEFDDTIEKKIRDYKIYSPFSLFKDNGFEFERSIGQYKKDNVSIRLFDNYTKIQYLFTYDFDNRRVYGNNIYRDINLIFTYDKKNNQWYGTNPNLLLEATYFATKENVHFNTIKFSKKFYGIKKKGSGFLVETLGERKKLNSRNRGYLMPLVQMNDNFSVVRNEEFFVAPTPIRKNWNSILANCTNKGRYILTDDDKEKLNSLYPCLVFNELAKFVRETNPTVDSWGANDTTFCHYPLYGKIPILDINFFRFKCSRNQYEDWLKIDYNICFQSEVKTIPKPLNY